MEPLSLSMDEDILPNLKSLGLEGNKGQSQRKGGVEKDVLTLKNRAALLVMPL